MTTASLTNIRDAFADRRLLEEDEEMYASHPDYGSHDDNNYAHDIEQFEYEVAARSYIPENEDYDYDDDDDDDYDDDWDDYDYE